MKIDELKAKVDDAGLYQPKWPFSVEIAERAGDCTSCTQSCQTSGTSSCSIGCSWFLWGM